MTQRTIEIVIFIAALLLAALAMHAWLSSRDEQQHLQSTLAAEKKILDASNASEANRNANLTEALAQIAALKKSVQTPEQIVLDLSKYLQLPQPIALADAAESNSTAPPAFEQAVRQKTDSSEQQGTEVKDGREIVARAVAPQAPSEPLKNSPPNALPTTADSCDPIANCIAQIPAVDLKPLDNFVQDCRACQTELSVAKQNSADDAAKIAALTAERNAAITASKGGTFLRRLRRNALWFSVGAGVASALGYAASH